MTPAAAVSPLKNLGDWMGRQAGATLRELAQGRGPVIRCNVSGLVFFLASGRKLLISRQQSHFPISRLRYAGRVNDTPDLMC